MMRACTKVGTTTQARTRGTIWTNTWVKTVVLVAFAASLAGATAACGRKGDLEPPSSASLAPAFL